MPAKPCGTLVVSPPLSDGQVDSLEQRIVFHLPHLVEFSQSYVPDEKKAGELVCWLLAKVLHSAFAEQYGGDESLIRAEIERIREEKLGVTQGANGYSAAKMLLDKSLVDDDLSWMEDDGDDFHAEPKLTSKLDPIYVADMAARIRERILRRGSVFS